MLSPMRRLMRLILAPARTWDAQRNSPPRPRTHRALRRTSSAMRESRVHWQRQILHLRAAPQAEQRRLPAGCPLGKANPLAVCHCYGQPGH
eukprot:6042033-Pleurochrysis_carterae.AAC.1